MAKFRFFNQDTQQWELIQVDNINGSIPNSQTWTSTLNQDTFTITNGEIIDVKLLEVIVGGVQQIDITLVNSTTFKLPELLPAGVKVQAKWYEVKVPATVGHKTTHEEGGQDELDVTQLKNFQEQVAVPLADIALNAKDFIEPTDNGDLSLAVQRAIDSIGNAVTNGVEILLPRGQHDWKTPVIIHQKDGLKIKGAGRWATKLIAKSTLQYVDALTLPDDYSTNAFFIVTKRRVTGGANGALNPSGADSHAWFLNFEGLSFHANDYSKTINGIFTHGMAHCTFKDIFGEHLKYGVNFGTGGVYRCTAQDVDWSNCVNGFKNVIGTTFNAMSCGYQRVDEGWEINAHYSTLTCCAIDHWALGKFAYTLEGIGITLNGCGLEKGYGGALNIKGRTAVVFNGFNMAGGAIPNATNWLATTAYSVGNQVKAGSNFYKCTVAGTSGTVAPSHTSGTATDGTVTWEFVSNTYAPNPSQISYTGQNDITDFGVTDYSILDTNVSVVFNNCTFRQEYSTDGTTATLTHFPIRVKAGAKAVVNLTGEELGAKATIFQADLDGEIIVSDYTSKLSASYYINADTTVTNDANYKFPLSNAYYDGRTLAVNNEFDIKSTGLYKIDINMVLTGTNLNYVYLLGTVLGSKVLEDNISTLSAGKNKFNYSVILKLKATEKLSFVLRTNIDSGVTLKKGSIISITQL